MAEGSQSLRIDWFDGTLIEETRQTFSSTSGFDEEEKPETEHKTRKTEMKPIGFKKLLELSMINPPALTLEIAHKTSFWLLLDSQLKDDFIVLIVTILSKVFKRVTPGDRSIVMKSFKSKLFKSIFIKTLKEYVSNLPNVRFAEKRINSHLWDDSESFFHNVILLCEGIIDIGNNKLDILSEIQELVEITRVSIAGVKKEHSERFDDGLYDKIDKLQWRVATLVNESTTKNCSVNIKDSNRENKLKHIPLFPSRNDLLGNIQCDIQPNIVNGAYYSVEHYLELQFKLLREDCFAPLREGISKYLANTSRKRHENIRVHPKVRVIHTHISNNKVGHLVDIAWKERSENRLFDFNKYTNNKQLMFGSLLLFTSDNFETVLCATVLDSTSTLLKDGYIAVIFQSPVSNRIFAEQYLMIESEVFFEPYHRVLKVLQNANITDLPMKKYIVDVQPETRPPSYLTRDTMYNLKTEKAEMTFPALDLDKWPRDLFDFDESQMEAYKFALTREFAVIQGPPGTGKTYIGVKIASTLLRNLALEGNPMLIICYTNHALDQFLEGLLNVTTSIVRLGSQSKSETLEPYTLNNVKGKIKSKYSHLYATKRSELKMILKDMSELQCEIEKCEKEIVSYKSIRPYLKIGDKHYELRDSKEDPVLKWLFEHLEVTGEELEAEIEANSEKEDWEKHLDDSNVTDRNLVTCFSSEWAEKEIDSLIRSKNYVVDVTDDEFVRTDMIEQFDSQISKIRDRLNEFKKYLKAHRNDQVTYCDHQVKSLYDLTTEQRWNIYFKAVETLLNEIQSQMDTLMEQHRGCSEEIEDISTLIDSEVVRTAKVVGVTTTVAARRHDLMTKLLSPIVIVEEAAEVLEAHIVASLTDHLQHLILIGDHKQLRPTASHHVLARDYNLEVSLFERMIRNGVHARTLTVQRRFTESVVRLLVPVVYDKLDCHPDIGLYRDVRGMAHNLYFHDHEVYEDSEEDSWSYRNTYEAKWCVAVATYLRLMKYESNEITILATYTGQATLIKELSKNNDQLRGTKVTVVDNYQGEENRIVILSLVRSNKDNNIGFLSAQNRICVALSRAKEGFYLFGNMNVLKCASAIWRFVNSKLVEQNAIGKKLTVHCETHKDKTIDVYKSEDLIKCVSGSCLRICEKNTN